MRYLSLCSGIEAASVAWHGMDWKPAGFAEIDAFPSAVLKHRFPGVRNYGDMTRFKEWKDVGTVDVMVGGTPCQSFSVAGLRKGLNDPRGNLMLTFGAIANHFRPRWVIWENVPGVLSSNKGRDFGAFLGMLAELGYGFAYRVLDAQFFGVAQRRRRVFVVGYIGDWRRAAAVLFESESLSWNPPPSREKGEGFAYDVAPCLVASGRGVERIGDSGGQDPVVVVPIDLRNATRNPEQMESGVGIGKDGDPAGTITTGKVGAVCIMDQGGQIMNVEYEKTGTLRAQMNGHLPIVYDCRGVGDGKTVPTLCTDQPASVGDYCPIVIDGQGGKGMSNITIENISPTLCSGGGGNMHAICMARTHAGGRNEPRVLAFNAQGSASQGASVGDVSPILDRSKTPAVCFQQNTRDEVRLIAGALSASAGMKQQNYLCDWVTIRRLTPVECERLQGFPDDWTRIPYRGRPAESCPDSPRYKACGNSMAVPVMRWIGERIDKVEKGLAK
jgi:DNA (cytosine-5)-methyltransferase 1